MRTRSAKSAANAKIQQALADSDEDMGSDGYSAPEESEEEEVSYGKSARTRRKSAGGSGPPAKKAKTTGSSPQTLSVATKPSRRKSLSVLVTMPLDILFEVFGHLTPKDLVSLSRTTKTLRATLLDKSAKSVWINARASVGAPDPPEDFSECRWAALLFGHHCMGCDAINIRTIDFLIRRRVCTSCKKQNLLVTSRVKKVFEGIDESILDYISPTNVGGWAHGHASSSNFYWKSDIENMLLTMAKYQADVRSRKKGAKQALEDFKTQRIETVKKIRENAAKYEDWVSTAAEERQNEIEDALKKRQEEIERRFMELGHAQVDLKSLRWRFYDEYKKKGQITERVWTRIRAALEPQIVEERQSRRDREDRVVRDSRRVILHRLFKAYSTTVPPSQWKYLPTTGILSGLQPFRDLIEGDASISVTEEDFTPHFTNMQEILTTARSELKTRLMDRCVAVLQRAPASPTISHEQLFELATTVFECERCAKGLFGWEEITSHFCTGIKQLGSLFSFPSIATYHSEYPYEIHFSESRGDAAKTVVQTANLDPKVATTADMDAKDLRFHCAACDAMPESPASYYYSGDRRGPRKEIAYTWRSCVEHIITNHATNHDEKIQVLSSAAIAAVKLHEDKLNHGTLSFWSCTHCDAHVTTPVRFHEANGHVQQTHNIASPREGVDLIHLPRARQDHCFKHTMALNNYGSKLATNKQERKEIRKATSSQQPFRWPVKCIHCASSSLNKERNRLFDIGGVRGHIQARPNVASPVKDVDYAVLAKADIPQSWKDKFQPALENMVPPS